MCLLFLTNCFTVLFDVATDQFILVSASSLTDFKFFGISNAIQIVSYKFGASFSGFVLQFLDYSNISSLFLLLSAIYGVILGILFFTLKTYIRNIVSVDKKLPNEKRLKIVNMFGKMFASKSNRVFILYILTYKLGEIGAVSLLPLYAIESGVNRQFVTFITTTICEPLSLAGSLLGGILWSVVKGSTSRLLQILGLVSMFRVIPLLVQIFVSDIAADDMKEYMSFSLMALLWFLSGLVSAFAFTLMAMISCLSGKNTYASYAYAIFSSAEVSGKIVISSQAGNLSSYFGKQNTFAIFVLFIVINFAVLLLLKPRLLCDVDINLNKKNA